MLTKAEMLLVFVLREKITLGRKIFLTASKEPKFFKYGFSRYKSAIVTMSFRNERSGTR